MILKTWPEIQESLRRYPIQSEGADVQTFGFPEVGSTPPVLQVHCADILGRQRIFIGVNVTLDVPSAAHDALVLNSELVIGALVAFKGVIVLKHVMTVGGFEDDELHEVISAMARSVARLRDRLEKPAPTQNVLFPTD